MENDHKKDLRLILDALYAVKYGAMQRWQQESESEKNEIYKNAVKEADNAIDAALELYSAAVENKPIVPNFPGTSPLILEKLPHEETPEEKARKNFDKLISRNKERFFDMSLKKSLMKEDD